MKFRFENQRLASPKFKGLWYPDKLASSIKCFASKWRLNGKPYSMDTQLLSVRRNDITFRSTSMLSRFDSAYVDLVAGSSTATAFAEADAILKHAGVVAFPTETVYGLAADATRSDAVQKIYVAKNRPSDNPLIVHIGSISQIERKMNISKIPEIYMPLIDKYWPGPLTIILPLPANSSSPLSRLVTSGGPTVAVRMPSDPIALGLLLYTDLVLAAPSANSSTRPSPTSAAHVLQDLNGLIPLILDGGANCQVGLESTVLDGLSSPPTILRPGGLSLEDIQAVGGPLANTLIHNHTNEEAKLTSFLRAPGMKYRHYSPDAKVLLLSPRPKNFDINNVLLTLNIPFDAKIGILGSLVWETVPQFLASDGSTHFIRLGDTIELVSRNLFSDIRKLDSLGCKLIIIESVEEKGIGAAIMNRCRKMSCMAI